MATCSATLISTPLSSVDLQSAILSLATLNTVTLSSASRFSAQLLSDRLVVWGGCLALVWVGWLLFRLRSDRAWVWWPTLCWMRWKQRTMAFAPGGIVFAGSSSIRYWESLVADMAPLRVLGQGFGGSKLSQLVTWTDRLIIAHQPRAVVVYSGENDLAGLLGSRRKTADDLVPMFGQIVERVQAQLPATRIYWVSIKKPPARREIWPEIDRANQLLAEFCAGDPQCGVIDVLTPMCDDWGVPREELYGADGIHLNESGYAVWTAVIRPRLLAESPEP